jgi:type I site-specific restriction-modification system R (restriction) subunit
MQTSHGQPSDSRREKRFLEKLRSYPELLERFEAILEITEAPTGTADQIEELLVAEVRCLGNKAMQEWAQGAEEQAAQELRQKTPRARVRKKRP